MFPQRLYCGRVRARDLANDDVLAHGFIISGALVKDACHVRLTNIPEHWLTLAVKRPEDNMARAFWKGAISFGLVYIPVELYSATHSATLDLDMLDKRDFSPVGYQRYNKRTGKLVEWQDIIKGYQYKKGQYVALSDEDFRRANTKASQTIEITSFTDSANITPEYFETPYYVAPQKGGQKVYALLREALRRTGKVAIAEVVVRTRQHLAVVLPENDLLVLNTLRFDDEIRSAEEMGVEAPDSKSAGLAAREISMAERLIEEMSGPWEPTRYHDTYREDLMKRIDEKVRNKETHLLTEAPKGARQQRSAEVIDLMSVLKQSLERGGAQGRKPARRASPGRSAKKKRA
jgi:DNA end-binding protein Ku